MSSSRESDSTMFTRVVIEPYPERDTHTSTVQLHAVELVASILWRVKQTANKLCWLASMCKYNTHGSYSYNHRSGQRGSTIDH
jgi:hypothetical protein